MQHTKALNFLYVFLCCVIGAFAQDSDTILKKILSNGSDTDEVKRYIKAGEEVYLTNLKLADHYWKTAYTKSERFIGSNPANSVVFKRLKNLSAEVLTNLGYVYNCNGSFDSAIFVLTKSIDLRTKFGKRSDLSDPYNNIAFAQSRLGNYSASITNQLKALGIREESHDELGIAHSLLNIANLYDRMGDTSNAYRIYTKAYIAYKKAKSNSGLINCLNSFAVMEIKNKNLEKGKGYLDEALTIAKDNKLFLLKYLTLHNIGYYYQNKKQYEDAIVYYLDCYKVYDSLKIKDDAISELINISSSYHFLNRSKEALKYNDKAIEINSEVNDFVLRKMILDIRYKILKGLGKTEEAYSTLLEFLSVKDSLNLAEIRNETVKKQMQYDFDKKAIADSLQFAEEKKINAITLSQQKTVSYFSIFAIVLLIIVVFLVFKNLRVSKKNNIVITEQKKEVEVQKHLIEEKNKEIIDSINYAKRLQDAAIPSPDYFSTLLPQSFIYYKPKDIVAGDFYWIHKLKGSNKLLVAAADCTGHGVPGALVSIVCLNALNRCVEEFGLIDPSKILDKTTEIIQQSFRQGENDVKDGMDIGLALLDLDTFECVFSGANNPIWILDEGKLNEIKGDSQPVGKQHKPQPFTSHKFTFKKNDLLILFTDGYADQFGGPNGKKLKTKAFKEQILKFSNSTTAQVKENIEIAFSNWKGTLEQVDDVLVIGIKI